ncbi:N-acetylmuramoyl-L-alanine amidase [Cytobacillus sp.]|uniref:N-acetylmuramoyl-L-alanine amidase n=1 Tax=Cytobacillus sp. TaxID=2675269 RepID=UPI0035172729
MVKKVKWDPGHGGSDPGAVGNALLEKVLTHKIVGYAMDYLEANFTGFTQSTTRGGDQTLSLTQRTDQANKEGADVFVSVHINAGGGKGFESFIYNGSISSATQAFQNTLHAEVMAAMRKDGVTSDRGKKRANFAVLRQTKMVACLTENLFIDTSDANFLKKEAFLKAVGEAHARGVAKFLGLPVKKSKPAAPKTSSSTTGSLYKVQVGAFAERANADRLAAELKAKGYPVHIVKQ